MANEINTCADQLPLFFFENSTASSVLVANFPPLDVTPDPSFGIGQQILAQVDLSDIPDIPVTDGTCAGSPTAAANAAANHWVSHECGESLQSKTHI